MYPPNPSNQSWFLPWDPSPTRSPNPSSYQFFIGHRTMQKTSFNDPLFNPKEN